MKKNKEASSSLLDRCEVRVLHPKRIEEAKRASSSEKEAARLASIYKALGDLTRIRMIMALLDGEMCVCDLAAFLGLTESAISHQLRLLREKALVNKRRDGQVLYYSLEDDHVSDLLRVGLDHVREKQELSEG
jgi:ArsR family transcriptional regulator, lead/cadmium/zinc/bismuth-responsive transcriptional repressor